MAIVYSGTTLNQLYDEIVIRLGDHRNAELMDWNTIVTYVNSSIREIVYLTVPLKKWAYTEPMAVSHLTTIPSRFISPVRLTINNETARKVHIKQWFTLSLGYDVWNADYTFQPIYSFWTNNNVLQIYISPSSTGVLEFYAIPQAVSLPTDVIPLSYEYMDLLVAMVMSRLFARIGNQNILQLLYQQIMSKRQELMQPHIKK